MTARGKQSKEAINQLTMFPTMIVIVRVLMGISMFELGLRLFLGGGWNAWPNIGVVLPGFPQGPIGSIVTNLWGNPVAIQLLMWGSMLIGAALITGTMVRLASYGGIFIMLSLYLSVLPPNSVWIDQHIIYILLFTILIVSRAGTVMGMDKVLTKLEQRVPAMSYLLG